MNKKTPSQDQRRQRLEQDPTCSKCGITKTIDDFPKCESSVDYWCTDCRREYARSAYRKKIASMSEDELAAYRAKVNKRQNRRRRKKLESMSDKERAAYREKINADNQRRRDEVRDEVYRAYGGYKCACCGITERMFLSIDHVNNDGAEHKREHKLRTGEQMYRWLKRNDFPDGFQVLCMNCQWGKRNNNGVCPHQVRCRDHPERE